MPTWKSVAARRCRIDTRRANETSIFEKESLAVWVRSQWSEPRLLLFSLFQFRLNSDFRGHSRTLPSRGGNPSGKEHYMSSGWLLWKLAHWCEVLHESSIIDRILQCIYLVSKVLESHGRPDWGTTSEVLLVQASSWAVSKLHTSPWMRWN